MAPLALCNFVAYDLLGKGPEPATGDEDEDGDEACVVALDIGTDNSNLVITDGERIIWQRPIPLGGNHFTRALTKDLKLTFAKAEHLKRNAAKSPDLKKILAALKPVLNDFVGEVQRSLGYFTNTHRDAQIQYMIGLGNAFRLPGLQKFLQEKLQLEVRKFQQARTPRPATASSTAPTFTENILSFAVAYGLALQGLKQPGCRRTCCRTRSAWNASIAPRSRGPWRRRRCLARRPVHAGLRPGHREKRPQNPEIEQGPTQAQGHRSAREGYQDEIVRGEEKLQRPRRFSTHRRRRQGTIQLAIAAPVHQLCHAATQRRSLGEGDFQT